ncbi:YgiQ family radical SAM protein [Aestuariirhabdus litorea]|uniref:YgiQ family radical SAM protein n=1 Tax=Aestuariirhabdus litorea TaxID=2528527 RepID=A0A3P3VLN6_9GAMM|nr:YgiQ family radical SAM protein [Aestuariirhabdus litorea]RRJ82639.1 YgiQ family radical SAM protein [Aestuariirhabdus litorea]RWW92800.1 YgiQ family radical SAM protein [Endozoicomonadaceae bacterium GTF-13]
MTAVTPLFSYRKYWAECFGTAPFLPMSRAEMEQLGWDSCDIIIVTGDAYVDHPSFGMAVIGRYLESQGFRVGIIAQPDWRSKEPFMALGEPNLFFGVTAGNMDSMINRYTADRRLRHDDAYTPGDEGGKRPDRAVTVYSQRCKEAYKQVPVVIGGIEASLRRLAHYDYWSDSVRRSVLIDSTADLLLYGNAERAIAEVAHRLANGETIDQITNIRGTAYKRKALPEGWLELDSTRIDQPGPIDAHPHPYHYGNDSDPEGSCEGTTEPEPQVIHLIDPGAHNTDPERSYIRLPSFEKVRNDPVLYAHSSRVFHRETNPGNARPLLQMHGQQYLWINPPPIPLETDELDGVFDLPYQRVPHPSYGDARIPAYEMIRFSVNIMRGCFGGCTFCSITEHEGRIIQSRSEASILGEIEKIRDVAPGFTGTISDLGGPTANMYQLNCKSDEIRDSCRRPSCVYPGICKNLITDHSPTTQLYRKARALPGIKRIAISSGLRYDLAVEDPEYVKELVQHHVGGYLKIAPEHTETGTLSKMMKPGMGTYYRFKEMFDHFSKEAGKEQYLIPYFIAAHPGCTDEDMLNLALWLKENKFRVDQVQNFYPSPMAYATAMYHSERNPLKKVGYKSEGVYSARSKNQRRLHKALLRYHDPDNWPLLREALRNMGKAHLIGRGKTHLVPAEMPSRERHKSLRRSEPRTQRALTQHTGLPPQGAPAAKRGAGTNASKGPRRGAGKGAGKGARRPR